MKNEGEEERQWKAQKERDSLYGGEEAEAWEVCRVKKKERERESKLAIKKRGCGERESYESRSDENERDEENETQERK